MLIRLLGPVEVEGSAAAAEFAGLRRKAVLATLALHRGDVVGSDLLVDMVWRNDPPANAANAMQRHISYLRGILGDRNAIVARPPGYVLNVARGCIDVERADDLRCAARRAVDRTTAERLLTEAHLLSRGRPMAELESLAGLAPAIEQLKQLQLAITQELFEIRLELRHYGDVIPALQVLVEKYPLHEHLHALLILALYGSGRQGDALAAHRTARELLVEELGVDPSRELADLESAILRGEHPHVLAVTIAARPINKLSGRHQPPQPAVGVTMPPVPQPRTRFIGRGSEQVQLAQKVGASRLMTVIGTAGSGRPGCA